MAIMGQILCRTLRHTLVMTACVCGLDSVQIAQLTCQADFKSQHKAAHSVGTNVAAAADPPPAVNIGFPLSECPSAEVCLLRERRFLIAFRAVLRSGEPTACVASADTR